MIMATVSLRHIEKVYPNTEKKRKKGEPLKKSNLKVTDEGVLAVEDFNLEIADREFIVLVGPSGCGKSTTLHGRRSGGRSRVASSTSTESWSTTWSPRTATSPWCFRTTRCTPI